MAKEKLSKGLITSECNTIIILDGSKKMLIRGSRTTIRNSIGIIKNGTGQVIGAVIIIDCIELNEFKFNAYREWHKLDCEFKDLEQKKVYGWILDQPRKFKKSVSHQIEKHKHGSWVDIDIKI